MRLLVIQKRSSVLNGKNTQNRKKGKRQKGSSNNSKSPWDSYSYLYLWTATTLNTNKQLGILDSS
jgi:hypothetical protein